MTQEHPFTGFLPIRLQAAGVREGHDDAGNHLKYRMLLCAHAPPHTLTFPGKVVRKKSYRDLLSFKLNS